MQNITVVVVTNPFSLEKEIHSTKYVASSTAVGYVRPLVAAETELVYSINGAIIDNPSEVYVNPGDYVVVCPVVAKGNGKNPLAIIAGIALSVVSVGVGNLAQYGTWTSQVGMAGWGFGAALAAATVMYIGGQLLSRLYSTATADIDTTTSNTYSWDNSSLTQTQGGAVPLTYGTVKVSNPTVLSQHISTDGTNQYYNLLLCGGEGPVDSISDIRINDNPITNYANVVVETRLGTNDQAAMTNFADTFADQTVSYELDEDSWSTFLLDGTAGQALEVTIEAPNGMYKLDSKGDYGSASVNVTIQYRLKDGAWSDWTTATISGSSSSAVRKTVRLDGLTAGQYEVRMKVASRSANKNSTTAMVRVYWTLATLIIYDDFSRPGKVLVGIKALATSQLSGSLSSVTWLQTRSKVQVYNPSTGTYEEKAATNPAWACYDLIHLGKQLMNVNTGAYEYCSFGAAKELFLYRRFQDWAAFCENKELTVNILLDSAKNFWKALEEIESCGRGKVLMAGTKFSCICDAPSDPVQMFGMGNIYMDTFQEEFLGLDDRANAIEVTFNNATKNYERDSFTAYSDSYDTSDEVENPTQITMNGKTSYEEAYREAKYQLRLNEYLIRTCSFEADVDAIACQVGDVILLSHDVPQWGYSGRLIDATDMTLTLGREVELIAGTTYGVYVHLNDDSLVYRQIQAVGENTTTNVLTVTTAFESVPETANLFMFGEMNKEAKPFRVASITRSQELRRKLACLEYNEAVYNEVENIPEIEYSSLANTISGLTVKDATDATGCNLDISWRPSHNYNGAVVLVDNVQAATVDVNTTAVKVAVSIPQTYTVTVIPISLWGNQGTATTVTFEYPEIVGDPPDNLDYFAVSYLSGKFVFSWKKTGGMPSTAVGYEFRKGDTWDSGQFIMRVTGADSDYATFPAMIGTTKFWVCPYNTHGYASVPLGDSITIDNIPTQQVIATYPDYDKACTLTGPGLQKEDYTLQLSTVTYNDIQDKTYSELKVSPLIGAAVGEVVLTGPVIAFGTLAQVQIIVDESWLLVPDNPNVYEISTSIDGDNFSEYKLLTTGSIVAMSVRLRITMTGVARPGVLRSMTVNVTAQQNTLSYSDVIVPVGGLTLTFTPAFLNTPSVIVSPNGDTTLTVIKSSVTNTSGTIQLVNSTGTDVGGSADIVVVGI